MPIVWESLIVDKTLNIDWHTKYIALLVNLKSEICPTGASSVLLANRHGFDSTRDLTLLLEPCNGALNRTIELLEHNDIYYHYLVKLNGLVECKLQLIHPASPMHITKYTKQERFFVKETPHMYRSILKPYIEDKQLNHRIRWIENILQGISEQDKIIVRKEGENGFIILPDSKWDQKSMSSMYLLAIINHRGVRSLRDLNDSHLDLLKDLRHSVETEIPRQFPTVNPRQLRLYVHYMPTYYYFHVHIVHVDFEMPGCAVGTAHLLDDIIDNIENVSSNYYQQRTLHYTLGSEHELYQLMKAEQ